MNKQRQRKLVARARRMESLHPTSDIAIPANVETEKKIKSDVLPTKANKTEKKQKDSATKNDKIKAGSVQSFKKESKDVSTKKKHNSKGVK
jgi:hypothetical protein